MKTYYNLFVILLVGVLFYACSAPYKVASNVQLRDDWIITSADVDGGLAGTNITSPVFEDIDIKCLTGSKWSFFQGGGGAYIPVANVSCVKGERKITWQVIALTQKSHFLQFFREYAPKGIIADRYTLYTAEITSLGKSTMVLKYPINYNGKTGNIIFTFNKVQ